MTPQGARGQSPAPGWDLPSTLNSMAAPPGERPAALLEPWPQGKVERHDGIAYELVHRLDVPVPQMGEQLPNVVQFFSAQLPVFAEPVIEVPKILPHDIPLRRLCREMQLAEQLVEVPTVLSHSSLQQLIVEQTVDIPVPGRAGRRGARRSSRFSWTGFNSVFWSRSC